VTEDLEADLLRRLLDGLSPEHRAQAVHPEAEPGAREWTYLPGDRPGLSLESLSEAQRRLVDEIIRARHSEPGGQQVIEAIARERHRRETVSGHPVPGDRYWIRVIGQPGESRTWGWQLTGHHLAIHAMSGPGGSTLTPHFVGAEPAVVLDAAGDLQAPLGAEERMAQQLVHSLDADQRAVAVASPVAPADILTRDDPVADPSVLPQGIERGDLTTEQQVLLDRLVRRHLGRAQASYAETCWSDEAATGLDRIRFAWCGDADLSGGRYYCVRASTFLIEYDNTQDDANHAHSVWRHLRDDWGDSLRQHYARAHDG
jgi:hypothetical protein